jgi:uncharacterized repeat protein (TIGR03803 family)
MRTTTPIETARPSRRIRRQIPIPTLAFLAALLSALVMLSQLSMAQSEATLYSFTGGNDGANPWGGLVMLSGNLYGSTALGGVDSCGVVFELQLSKGKWKESVLYTFTGPDGCTPVGNVAADATGNIYGSTQNGGANGDGVAYRISPAGNGTWTEEVLYTFPTVGGDGNTPFSGVILDAAGNVYGSTIYGGGKGYQNGCRDYEGCGTIFKLTPNGSSWTETVLYRFTGGADGAYPNALTLDSEGRLYGTTGGGGTSGYAGTIFRLVPSGTNWKIETLYEFTGNADGAYPAGALTLDSSGNVYGTTTVGGAYFAGNIFELLKPTAPSSGWNFTNLYSFTGNADGAAPEAGLVFDKAGNLYGTTAGNEAFNNSLGSVFELHPYLKGEWAMLPLYDFTGFSDGDTPFAGVILGPDGGLYGTSSGIQGSGYGAVYAIKP